MKQYKGSRKLDDIVADMKAKEMNIEDSNFEQGGDSIQFWGSWYDLPLTIMFNTVSGRFYVFNGMTGKLLATERSAELDETTWYVALMDTLYKQ